MFCPKCKSEYRDGYYKCATCNIDLVPEIPTESEQEPEFIEWEEVLSTKNNGDIALLKSILDSENITYYFHGEHFNVVRPWVQPAILMVDRNDVEKTNELIKDLKFSFSGISLNEDQDDNGTP
jgi:hypothetical protein